MGSWFALGLLIVTTIILVTRDGSGTIAGLEPGEFASMVALFAILIFLSGSLFGGYRGRIGRAMRDGAAWALFGLVLVVGYTYKEELLPHAYRIVGELVPGTPLPVEVGEDGRQSVRIRKQYDGHFVARTDVNGVPLNMIVDTGASTVVLTIGDARQLGIDVNDLTYSVPVQTANGRSFAAQVRLDNVAIGTVKIANVNALIAKDGALHHSLLGMSFLSRLRSYEFSGDFLTLRG
jgi:aspartyl protease family protein